MGAYGGLITVAVGKVTGVLSNFTALITEDNFATAAIDGGVNSILNGGGNLRCYTDKTKAVQIPIEVVTFVTGITPNIQVWVLSPTLQDGDTVYLEADTVATAQPAFGGAFGRDATWAEYAAVYNLTHFVFSAGAVIISSTGLNDGTQRNTVLGGPPVEGDAPFGSISWGTSNFWIDIPPSLLANKTEISVSQWIKDPTYNDARLLQGDGNEFSAWADNANRMDFLLTTGLRLSNANTGSLTGWVKQTVQKTGTHAENIVNKITPIASTASTTTTTNVTGTTRIAQAASGAGDQYGLTTVRHTAVTLAQTDAEYDNQSSPSTFWEPMATWEDQDAGVTPTDLIFNNSTFGLTSEQSTLQRITNIIYNDSTFGLTSESIIIQRIIDLLFNSSTFGLTSDQITLRGTLDLVFNSSTFGMTSEQITLQRITNIVYNDSTFGLTSEQIIIQRIVDLLFNDSTFGLTSESITLSTNIILEMLNSTFGMTSEQINLQRFTNIEFSDSTFGLTSEQINLQRFTKVSFNNSTFGLTSDMITLITDVMPDLNNVNALLMTGTINYKLTNDTTHYKFANDTTHYKLTKG